MSESRKVIVITRIKVRTVEGHTEEFGITENGGISEVPDGGAKNYPAADWRGIRRKNRWKPYDRIFR